MSDSYGPTQQWPLNYSPQGPYANRHSDELRLTAILERIERRLIAIEKRLDDQDRNRTP
ncbi:MAG: hypothetical protein AB7F72_11385 [Afipia sp.]